MNSVAITGRIASDIELSYTPSNTAMAKFRVAVRDPFRKGDDGKAMADFFDVVAWRNSAEFASNYLAKGSPVALKGKLRQETWQTKDGDKRSRIVINADDVEANGPNPTKAGEQAAAAPPQQAKPAAAAAPAPVAEEADFDPFADDV